jgi:hypothetical protein
VFKWRCCDRGVREHTRQILGKIAHMYRFPFAGITRIRCFGVCSQPEIPAPPTLVVKDWTLKDTHISVGSHREVCSTINILARRFVYWFDFHRLTNISFNPNFTLMDRNTFAAAIDDTQILGMRIIAFSFLMGVLFLVAFALYMFITTTPDPAVSGGFESGAGNEDTGLALTMTIVSLAYFIAAIPLSGFLFRRMLKPGSSREPIVIIGNIRSAQLVRLAVLDGAALLGAVSVLVAAIEFQLHGSTILWSGLLPVAYFMLHVLTNIPSKEQVLAIYTEHIEPELVKRA